MGKPKRVENPTNRIRELRLAHGMSLDRVAKISGHTAQILSRFERGEREIFLDDLQRIVRALDTDVGQLLLADDNAVSLTDDDRAVIAAMCAGLACVAVAVRVVAESLAASDPGPQA